MKKKKKYNLAAWIYRPWTGDWECEKCGKVINPWQKSRFCPDCGKMMINWEENKNE